MTVPPTHPKYRSPAAATLVGLLALGLLTASFSTNALGVVDPRSFASFQRDSESLVIGRILQTRAEGWTSEGGLTGVRSQPGALRPGPQYQLYADNDMGSRFIPYRSHPGANGWLASAADGLLPRRQGGNLTTLHTGMAALTAGLFSLATALTWRRFGALAAVVLLAGTLLSPWVTMYARNLWWCLWAMYLPMLGAAWCVRRSPSHRVVAAVGVVGMAVKVGFTGFEFVSTVFIAGLIPFVYALAARLSRASLRSAAIYASAMAAVGALGLGVLTVQNASQSGSWSTGLTHIWTVLGNRTHGDPLTHEAVYQAALSSTVWRAVSPYLFDLGPYSLSGSVYRSYSAWCAVAAVTTVVALWAARGRGTSELRGLAAATLCAFLASMSWFILFKGHAFIHVHMDAIAWHLAFVPVSLVLLGSTLAAVVQRARGSS